MIFLKKNTTESQDRRNCLSARAIFVICTRVITSHSRYMRVHSFSANQMSVIFHVHYCMKNQLVFKNFKEHVGLKRVERSGMFDESYS